MLRSSSRFCGNQLPKLTFSVLVIVWDRISGFVTVTFSIRHIRLILDLPYNLTQNMTLVYNQIYEMRSRLFYFHCINCMFPGFFSTFTNMSFSSSSSFKNVHVKNTVLNKVILFKMHKSVFLNPFGLVAPLQSYFNILVAHLTPSHDTLVKDCLSKNWINLFG